MGLRYIDDSDSGCGYGFGYRSGDGYGCGYGSCYSYAFGSGDGSGMEWQMNIHDDFIAIGCKSMSVCRWLSDGPSIAANEGVPDASVHFIGLKIRSLIESVEKDTGKS